MKIVILSDTIPPEAPGGAGPIAWALAKALYGIGHEVYVVASTPGPSFEEDRAGLPTLHLHSAYRGRWQPYFSLYNPQTVGALRRFFKRVQPDVVHAHNIHAHLSYHALTLARQAGARVVFTSHDVMPFAYNRLRHFIDPRSCQPRDYRLPRFYNLREMRLRYNPFRNPTIRRVLMNSVDVRLAVSEAHRQALVANGLTGFEVVHNALDARPFDEVTDAQVRAFRLAYGLPDDRPVILFGGRLSEDKGGETLLRALKLGGGAVALLVLSRTEPTQHIKDAAMRTYFEQIGMWAGWMGPADLPLVFRAVDIVAAPSLVFETFGMMGLEAMAAGKPAVVSCFGGPPEVVVDDQTGLVVNPYDTKTFADRLARLLVDPSRRRQMGAAGRARQREQFTLAQHVEATLAYYV